MHSGCYLPSRHGHCKRFGHCCRPVFDYTQNPTSSGWLQSLLLLSRFCTIKKRNQTKSSRFVWYLPQIILMKRLTYLGNTLYEFNPSIQNPVLSISWEARILCVLGRKNSRGYTHIHVRIDSDLLGNFYTLAKIWTIILLLLSNRVLYWFTAVGSETVFYSNRCYKIVGL